MIKNVLLPGLIFFLPFADLSAQVAAVSVTVRVPLQGSYEKDVYITGSFNGWQAGDSLYRMNRVGDAVYTITLPLFDNKPYQYKYTLGKWDKVEVAFNDSDIENRRFISVNGKTIDDTVAKWKQPKKTEKPVVSPQMQQINAMKDSTMKKIQPELNNLLSLLKAHIQNQLQEHPDEKKDRQIRKEADQKLKFIHDELRKLLQDVLALIPSEQKKELLKGISQPGSDDGDFINTFMKALESNTNAPKQAQ